jgi:predicted RNA-binding Zn-ribbon protein involved in translation (DUF1610 family)
MITLPTGIWVDGEHQRRVDLRPLCGRDEEFLLDVGEKMPASTRTSHLLANCLTQFGTLDLKQHNPLTLVRALPIGDREAMLLSLRQATLGNRMSSVMTCPQCGERMDIDLQVGDLLLPPYESVSPTQRTQVGTDGSAEMILYHLPTGADQEAVVALAKTDLADAEKELLQRCVIGQVSEQGLAALPALLAELDPQAEIRLNVTCPECGHAFSALFDTASFFFREIMNRAEHLYREVHLLAFYYHWSEAEILGMTMVKRQRYLNLLESALTEQLT